MMMMTIWWSKATRLLEFSHSCRKRYAGNNGTRGYSGSLYQIAFFVIEGGTLSGEGEEEGEGLVLEYSSSWMYYDQTI